MSFRSLADQLRHVAPGWVGRQGVANFLYRAPLFPIAVAMGSGIMLDAGFGIPIIIWLGAGILLLPWIVGRSPHQSSRLPVIGLLMWVACMGGIRHALDRIDYHSDDEQTFAPEAFDDSDSFATVVEGRLIAMPIVEPRAASFLIGRPDRASERTVARIQTTAVRSGTSMVPTSQRLRLTIDGDGRNLSRGDTVRIYGRWMPPRPPTNPGAFDPRGYFRNEGLHGSFSATSMSNVTVRSHGSTIWRPLTWLTQFADQGRVELMRRLGPQAGPLAVGMVLGRRDAIDNDVSDLLLATGTVHLLSVSGLHLAIVVSLVSVAAMMIGLRLSIRMILVFAIGIFYVALTGGRPPVIRAAILVGTLWAGYISGRTPHPFNALSLAGMVLMMLSPRNLFQTGVLLSFVAVTSLIGSGRQLLQPSVAAADAAIDVDSRLSHLIDESRSRWYLRLARVGRAMRAVLWASLAVTSVTTPLVWYHFHVVSPISVIINVLLSPVMSVALGSGLLTVLAAPFSSTLAWIPALLAWGSTTLMLRIIEFGAAIPLGHGWFPSPPVGMVWMFYIGLLATTFLPRNLAARIIRIGFIAGWLGTAWYMSTSTDPVAPESVRATFVDVGHGTSVLIRAHGGNVLYDCGRMGNDEYNSRQIEDVIWHEKLTALDAIFLSHADADHFNALPGLLERFGVGTIYTPPGMLDEPELALQPIRDAIQRHAIPVQTLHRGDSVPVGDRRASILHPPPQRLLGTDNANSMVCAIEVRRRAFILPGDLEPPGTAAVVDAWRPNPGGVIMAPHHGSLRMQADRVLAWARPSDVIVSGARRAARIEVLEMLSQTGAAVHVTSSGGATRVDFSPTGTVAVRQFLTDPW